MTTSETMEELTRRGQQAFANAWKIWADAAEAWRPFTALWPVPDAKLPSAEEFVDNAYDFAEQALATQRDFTKKMLAAARSAANNTARVAQDATKAAAANSGVPTS
ncbi:MAG TPA: hypothetical protein VE673_03455 [Pseudonocardiaceae bacterium]|nr:hypothetical protein [Pseudonocardiaceae bacterium]